MSFAANWRTKTDGAQPITATDREGLSHRSQDGKTVVRYELKVDFGVNPADRSPPAGSAPLQREAPAAGGRWPRSSTRPSPAHSSRGRDHRRPDMRRLPGWSPPTARDVTLEAGLRPGAGVGAARVLPVQHSTKATSTSWWPIWSPAAPGPQGPDTATVVGAVGQQGHPDASRWCWPTRTARGWWRAMSPSYVTTSKSGTQERRHLHPGPRCRAAGRDRRRPARPRRGSWRCRGSPRGDRRAALVGRRPRRQDVDGREQPRGRGRQP